MEIYLIGKTIREFRLRKKLSQEKVSDGICAVSTLSRIESGRQIPNRKLAEALFSKMGVTPPLYAVPMKESDIVRWNLEYEISNSVANRKYEIKNLLRQYRQCSQEMDIFEQQFHTFFCTVYNTTHGTPPEKTLPFYLKALTYTIPDFTSDTGTEYLSSLLLTKIERMIINNIAITFYNLQKTKTAEELLLFLKTYFESQQVDETERAKDYPVILYNLSNWEGLEGKYPEALEVTQKGIAECIKYGQLPIFPYLIFNKGFILLGMKKRTEGKKHIQNAFTMLDELSKHSEVSYLSKKINNRFGLHFPEC